MKLVFVAPRFHTNQYEIVRKLQSEGYNVEFNVLLIGATEDHILLSPKVYAPCLLSRLIIKFCGEGGVNHPRSFPNPLKYYKDIKCSRPDYLILRDPNRWFSILAAICARMQKIKIIYYTQTPLHKRYTPFRRVATLLLLKTFNAAWFTPLKGEPARYPYHPKWMYFVPFAVPIWNQELRSLSRPPKILMVGKMHERKNHVLLLKALAKIKDAVYFRLTMIGECVDKVQESQKKSVCQTIELLGLGDCVDLAYNIPFKMMRQLYLEHDLFILPAKNEPAAISVLEAYANGLPAICSSTNGTRFYIENGVNGYVFNCGDVNDLASKIALTILDRNVLCRMQQTSRQLGYQTASAENYYQAFINMIKDRWHQA
jgi:glycosyltransferase involved in cell wall biosynthesis